jgi:hypothetical protein
MILMSNMMGATSGLGSAYPVGEPGLFVGFVLLNL